MDPEDALEVAEKLFELCPDYEMVDQLADALDTAKGPAKVRGLLRKLASHLLELHDADV